MSQAEGTMCRKTGKGPVCSPLGLELAQSFLDCNKWSFGKEKYICFSFQFHFERNVHRRDVGGITKERCNHKTRNAWCESSLLPLWFLSLWPVVNRPPLLPMVPFVSKMRGWLSACNSEVQEEKCQSATGIPIKNHP